MVVKGIKSFLNPSSSSFQSEYSVLHLYLNMHKVMQKHEICTKPERFRSPENYSGLFQQHLNILGHFRTNQDILGQQKTFKTFQVNLEQNVISGHQDILGLFTIFQVIQDFQGHFIFAQNFQIQGKFANLRRSCIQNFLQQNFLFYTALQAFVRTAL